MQKWIKLKRPSMENGVLTVTVPKVEEAKKPDIKHIEVSG